MTLPLFPPKPSRRSITIATIVSVLAHLAIFAIPISERIRGIDALSNAGQPPMSVVLLPPAPELKVEPAPVPSPSAVPPPASRPRPRPRPIQKEVEKAPEVLVPPVADPVPMPTPSPDPPVDMLAMLNAARERRKAAAPRENAEPTPDQVAMANINRNIQTLKPGGEGTSGVFQILRKGHRTAEFAFNGFRTDRKWREVIEVDAGVGGDVDLAIVRRMIELIRGHYSGNFNWESHRLGRTVVLSARPADQAVLEAFLMREFFGTATLGSAR